MINLSIKSSEILFPELRTYIDEHIRPKAVGIDVFRKKILQGTAEYLFQKYETVEQANVLFVCTHNSRRSHLSQIWAQTAAYYFGLETINCFSGGTEVTALYPSVANALKKVGFIINVETKQYGNPNYLINTSNINAPIIAFSKLYNNAKYNPTKNFCTVITCTNAEKNCPVVNGADRRFALHYTDPKLSDNTTEEAATYFNRSEEIAVEMFFIMEEVVRKLRS